MTRIDKLYGRLIANPRAPIPIRDFERLLIAFGFEHVRTTGSHRQYVHPRLKRPLPVLDQALHPLLGRGARCGEVCDVTIRRGLRLVCTGPAAITG